MDYTATAPNPELLSPLQASLDGLGVAVGPQWDPATGPAPAGLAGGADLVACNLAWGTLPPGSGEQERAAELVANLASGAKEGGFVLLHTLLKGETMGETVAFLSTPSQSTGSQPGLLTQADWEKVFSEASLTLAAVKKSFYGSALFLCRRKVPSKQPIFMAVDGTD